MLTLLLAYILLLPTFLPFFPHDAAHALHAYHTSHHGVNDAHEHKHSHQDNTENHQSLHIDALTFFNDYLHVDLKKPVSVELNILTLDAADTGDVGTSSDTLFDMPYRVASIKTRAPPYWRLAFSHQSSLYLTTQRLRI